MTVTLAPGSVRYRLLDLYCSAGGAAMGYHRAGFEVVGVDIKPQPRYPFRFHQADALDREVAPGVIRPGFITLYGHLFDAFHGSPPCQRYSDLAKRNGNGHTHPDDVALAREAFQRTGKPWVIENVEGAPLIDPVWLCGTTFPELAVIRHRGFETGNFTIPGRPCYNDHPLVYTRDKRKAHYGKLDEWSNFVSVNGGGNCSVARAREAMGIDWMTKGELNEAVPPPMTEYVGRALMAALS